MSLKNFVSYGDAETILTSYANEIAGKVDKVTGKGLSTEDYTSAEKTKLAGIANNATNIGGLYPNSVHGEIFNDYSSNQADGSYSHAEGYDCIAAGNYSHAEGRSCMALSDYSHASGNNTQAETNAQTAIGRYNVSDNNGTYAFIIGNGSAYNARSNAFAVDWNGLIYVGNSATGVDVTNLSGRVTNLENEIGDINTVLEAVLGEEEEEGE